MLFSLNAIPVGVGISSESSPVRVFRGGRKQRVQSNHAFFFVRISFPCRQRPLGEHVDASLFLEQKWHEKHGQRFKRDESERKKSFRYCCRCFRRNGVKCCSSKSSSSTSDDGDDEEKEEKEEKADKMEKGSAGNANDAETKCAFTISAENE